MMGFWNTMHGIVVTEQKEIEREGPDGRRRSLGKVGRGLAAIVRRARSALSRANMQRVPRPGGWFLRVEGSKHF
jgi:hypothetical protein